MAGETDTERLVVLVEARITDIEKNLAKASATSGREFGKMRRDAKSATASMEADVIRSTKRINDAVASTSSKIGAFGAGAIKGFAASLAAVGVAGAVKGFRDLAKEVANIGNEARRAGLSTKAFQELSFVASQTRIPIDALVDGMKELSLRADEFIVTGAGSAADAFKRIGFGADDLKSKLKDPSALLVEIVARMKNLDQEAQIRIADELFGGTGGEQFVELLRLGSDGIKQMIADANSFGLVLDEQMIAKADEVDRKFDLLAKSVGTGLKRAIVEAGQALGTFMDQFDKIEEQQDINIRRKLETIYADRNATKTRLEDVRQQQANSWTPRLYEPQIKSLEAELEKQTQEALALRDILDRRAGLTTDSLENVGKAADDAAEKLGQIPAPTFSDQQRAAEASGVYGGVVGDYTNNVVAAESGGNRFAKNPSSSATGLGQFIESTWISLFRKNFPALAADKADSDILKLRTDAAISRKLIEAYAQENAAILAKAGVSVDQAALHLAHFLGPGDAAKVLRAAPGTPLAGLVAPASIKANPTILGGGRTVDDARAYAERRAGNTRRAAGNFTPEEEAANEALRQRNELAKEQAKSYQDIIAGSVEFISAQRTEAAAVGMTTVQAQALRYEQELLNQASAAGLEVTPQQAAQFKMLAQGMAEAETAAADLADRQEQLQAFQAEFGSLARDSMKGLVDDMLAGKSAGEALENVLRNIASRLMDLAIDNLFESLMGGGKKGGGGGGLGDLLGSLFGGGGGGLGLPSMPAYTGPGPAGFFSGGGWTGAGSKYEPAGIVHKDEYVFDKESVNRIGLPRLAALHRGYAEGGLVGSLTAASPPAPKASSNAMQVTVVNPPGTPLEASAQQRQDGSTEIRLRKLVRDEVTTSGRDTNKLLRAGNAGTPLRRITNG